ncbi:MAG: hypothetical protein LBH39_03340, partial [Clostridiales Family XIII bacterium]|nr:hypothetical protein [Clostridiales Family XIII bacterium]
MKRTDDREIFMLRHAAAIRRVVALLLLGLFISGDGVIYILVYIMTFVILASRVTLTPSRRRVRMLLGALYAFIMSVQIVYCVTVVFWVDHNPVMFYVCKLFATFLAVFPFWVERLFTSRNYTQFYMPSVQEVTTFTFNEIKENTEKIRSVVETLNKSGNVLASDHLNSILNDIPRHNSFRYINNGNLTEEYFAVARENMRDPYVYIIISNTGSPASEMISLFTGTEYNHASLAFDSELKTIVS